MRPFLVTRYLGIVTVIALIGSGCSDQGLDPNRNDHPWVTPQVDVALDPDTVEVAPGATVPLEIGLEGEEGDLDSYILISSVPTAVVLLDTANLSVTSVTDPDTLWITTAGDAPKDSMSVFVTIGWSCDGSCDSSARFFLRVLGSG